MPSIEKIMNNFNRVTIGHITVWFSYETAIAFRLYGDDEVVLTNNNWGRTTGKHINHIKGFYPFKQLPYEVFKEAVTAIQF